MSDKTYFLKKMNLLGIEVKKIIYDYDLKNTSEPTKFIRIIIHHTGSKQKTIQDIIHIHMKRNKWSSIGYHFLISKSGTIYYSRDLKHSGAHTYHHNRNSIGIALFGNFDNEIPTKKQIESLKNLTKMLKDNYQIKEILGHNEAIYKYVKSKYYNVNLPEINPINIKSKEEITKFFVNITTEILKHDSTSEAVRTIKRIKTCPGLNLYQIVKELR